jgi:hypothetical protein
MPPELTVVVLHDSASRADIERARQERGWHLANIVPAAGDRPFQMMFLSPDEHGMLHFVDDGEAGARYFVLREGAQASAAAVRSSLPAYGEDEVARLVRSPVDRAERLRGLRCLAVGAGIHALPRAALVALLDRALGGDDAVERGVALVAAERLRLSELGPALRRVAVSDADLGVRGRAADVLCLLDASAGART